MRSFARRLRAAFLVALLALLGGVPAAAPAGTAEAAACTDITKSGIQKAKQPHTFSLTAADPGGTANGAGIWAVTYLENYNLRHTGRDQHGGEWVTSTYWTGSPERHLLVTGETLYFTLVTPSDRAYVAVRYYTYGMCRSHYDVAYWVK